MDGWVKGVENFVFRHKNIIVGFMVLITFPMAFFASELRLSAGFEKTLPQGHEYIDTYIEYQQDYGQANRVLVAVANKDGSVYSPQFLEVIKNVTDDLFFIPGVDRRTVTSIWTPNTRFLDIQEDGIVSGNVIPLAQIRDENDAALVRTNVTKAELVGRLVSNDFTAAMITADLQEIDPETREVLDYLDVADKLEEQLRTKYEKDNVTIHIIGFAKMTGDIADGSGSVITFFGGALILTAILLYIYSQSWVLTLLPLACSGLSVVWQFGLLTLLGFGLDPLAILVPFLVFAIGVSHGVQQINLIGQEVAAGKDRETAARTSFSLLLIPGITALAAAFVGFGTLYLIPIRMIQEMSITSSIGIAGKILTNLFLLPLAASYITLDKGYAARANSAIAKRDRIWPYVARIAKPRNAIIALVFFTIVFVIALQGALKLPIGDMQAGSPELRADSRYNQDVDLIVNRFSVGVDVITVIAETPADACVDAEVMALLDRFQWFMANVPGVQSAIGLPLRTKEVATMWREGNLKWSQLPRGQTNLSQSITQIEPSSGLLNDNCSILPLQVYTVDHKAETINTVVNAMEDFRARPENQMEGVTLRLATGNVGVMAATNEVVHAHEIPMLIYVYIAIMVLVYLTYWDWRAMICCVVPLTIASAVGYWFMFMFGIGLKIATLPVMALAVGIGVDYGIYIYARMQRYLNMGWKMEEAYARTLKETGTAVVFTGLTLSAGVFTWVFSDLQFQADMGGLLSFMFFLNMVAAITALPALATVLQIVFPRKAPMKIRGGH